MHISNKNHYLHSLLNTKGCDSCKIGKIKSNFILANNCVTCNMILTSNLYMNITQTIINFGKMVSYSNYPDNISNSNLYTGREEIQEAMDICMV